MLGQTGAKVKLKLRECGLPKKSQVCAPSQNDSSIKLESAPGRPAGKQRPAPPGVDELRLLQKSVGTESYNMAPSLPGRFFGSARGCRWPSTFCLWF